MGEFWPKFQVTNDISVAADMINRPHEDYPRRVSVTERYLRNIIEGDIGTLDPYEIRQIHNDVMWDMIVDRGVWRTCDVVVGGHYRPPSHLILEDELHEAKLFPIFKGDRLTVPWEWYKTFQEIHPFRDGNGRVGGIVIAWLTYNYTNGTMLAPCQ